MSKKPSWMSTEVVVGSGLAALGLLALASGRHDLVSQALAPFGGGLVLSDALARAGRATRERVKVRVRRDRD